MSGPYASVRRGRNRDDTTSTASSLSQQCRRFLHTLPAPCPIARWGRACVGLTTLIVAMLGGCRQNVTRISDGSTRLERPISAEAYAAFGRARLLELKGETRAAIEAYLEVLDHDPEAAEAYVRIGALRCYADPNAAADAFASAERRSPASAELHRTKSRCALLHRRTHEAMLGASRALQLAPDRESSLLLIEAQRAAGRLNDARRSAWAHVAMFPDDSRGWITLAELLDPNSPVAAQLMRRAAERVPDRVAYTPREPEGHAARSQDRLAAPLDRKPAAKLALDTAFAAGDVRAIHRSARILGLNTLELVERAMAAGAFEFARSQATIAGQISPDDLQVWQLRLSLADLLGDDTEFDSLLDQRPSTPISSIPQSDFGVLFRVIENRTGIPAAVTSVGTTKE